MTALQLMGAMLAVFMLWWNASLIRSTARQRRWPRTEAQVLAVQWWGTRCRLRFVLPDGTEVESSCGIDPEAPRPVRGDRVPVVYDPCRPARCELAMAATEIAGLRLIGFAAMAAGVVMVVWG
jgi:hypothetical protein